MVVQPWHDFFIIAGTAAATLVGLLFVGLSLHLRAVLSRSEVRSLARVTLANFGLILFVSLFMVIPQGPTGASQSLIGAGVFSLIVIAPSFDADALAVLQAKKNLRLLEVPGLDERGHFGGFQIKSVVGGAEELLYAGRAAA